MHQINDDLLLCQKCNGQLIEPKSLSCRHTFCKACLLTALNTSSSATYHSSSPLKCPICKQQMSDITTPDDIDNLKCNFFELNLINAYTDKNQEKKTSISDECKLRCDNSKRNFFDLNLINAFKDTNQEKETNLLEEQNLSFVKYSEARRRLSSCSEVNCSDENNDNLIYGSTATKCATHPDFYVTFCCIDCQTLLCNQCMKDIWLPNNSHSTHRVHDLKTAWNFIRDGIQYCNETAEHILKEYLEFKEEICTKIKSDAQKNFDLLMSVMAQQFDQIDANLKHAFDIDEKYLEQLKRECNELTTKIGTLSFPFSNKVYNNLLCTQPSVVCNLLKSLNNATETVAKMQRQTNQLLNKRHIHLEQETTEERAISDLIRSFIGQVVIEEQISEVKLEPMKQSYEMQSYDTSKKQKIMKANFCHRLLEVSLNNLFADDCDGFSIFDNKTFSVYNFDSSFSLTHKIEFQQSVDLKILKTDQKPLMAYRVSDKYVLVSNSQRNRTVGLYSHGLCWCVKEVSPLVNAEHWALYPLEHEETSMPISNELSNSATSFPSKNQSSYEIKCAHAYVTRNVTKRLICLKFCPNDQLNGIIIVQRYKTAISNTEKHIDMLSLVENTIIPQENLLLTANKDNSLLAIAYAIHIFVLDSFGSICYQFDSTKIPSAMCFSVDDKVILATLMAENGAYTFEVTKSSNNCDQAVLTYDLDQENVGRRYGRLRSIAVNKDDILFLATNNGYIWALSMK